MTKKKLIIIVVVALVAAGGAYKFVLAKPKEKAPKPKVHGTVYMLPKEFLVNLADGRFAKLQVALVLDARRHVGRRRRRPRRRRAARGLRRDGPGGASCATSSPTS